MLLSLDLPITFNLFPLFTSLPDADGTTFTFNFFGVSSGFSNNFRLIPLETDERKLSLFFIIVIIVSYFCCCLFLRKPVQAKIQSIVSVKCL